MNPTKYDPIDYPEVYKIHLVGLALKRDPAYIKNSPYSDLVKKTLTDIFTKTSNVDLSSGLASETLSELNLETETQFLYEKTKEMMQTTKDLKDNISLIKNAHDLLSKLLETAEKAKNLRYIKDLEKVVIEVTNELTPEQKAKIIQVLKVGE